MSLPTETLQSLKLDAWYKVLITGGFALLIVSLFFEVKGITNTQLQLLAGGAFFIGLGIWANLGKQSWIKPPTAYTGGALLVTETVWAPNPVGFALLALGGLLVVGGVCSLAVSPRINPTPTLAVGTEASLTQALSPTLTATPTATATSAPTVEPTPVPVATTSGHAP
jgi:hypothetical protein